jgi:CheY-like chemotaxis protein
VKHLLILKEFPASSRMIGVIDSHYSSRKLTMTRILVVDDETDTLNVLRLFLELSGYEAVTTLNSADALTLAEVENPDCILLDVMMPAPDGFSLCKMMRAHPLTTTLPIIFVTAYSPLDLEERRREVGADAVLMKPFGMDSLIQSVEKLIAQRTPTITDVVTQPTQIGGSSVPTAPLAPGLQGPTAFHALAPSA